MSGTFIDITLRDGTTIPAYVTQPAKGSGPGIVLLHDTAGLDDFVRQTADLYAEEGYVVLAPQLPGHDPKPGGIAVTRSPCDIHTSCLCGKPANNVQVSVAMAACPYSRA